MKITLNEGSIKIFNYFFFYCNRIFACGLRPRNFSLIEFSCVTLIISLLITGLCGTPILKYYFYTNLTFP